MSAEGLSNREAARVAGVSHTAIAKAKKSGHLAVLANGNVSAEALDKWLSGRRAPRGNQVSRVAAGGTYSPVETDEQLECAIAALTAGGTFLDRAKAELHRDSYVARMRQLQFEREAGKVVEVEHVSRIVGESLARVRTRLLAAPAERAPDLHRCKTVMEVQAMLTEIISEALEELVSETDFDAVEDAG